MGKSQPVGAVGEERVLLIGGSHGVVNFQHPFVKRGLLQTKWPLLQGESKQGFDGKSGESAEQQAAHKKQ